MSTVSKPSSLHMLLPHSSRLEREPVTAINNDASSAKTNVDTVSRGELAFVIFNPAIVDKPYLVGASRLINDIKVRLNRVSESDVNVLITGETGTGKELAARALHDFSHRSKGPFIAVNCSAIPEHLIESELFGHSKGSFTGAIKHRDGLFESANGGTIFLDEIGELKEELLLKLIRVVKTGKLRKVGANNKEKEIEVNVRVIAASNRDLRKLVKRQESLVKLCTSVCGFSIHMPPLREHLEDIGDIALSLLYRNSNLVSGKTVNGISSYAIRLLKEHNWPGNVRELENVIKRAIILTTSNVIEDSDICIGNFLPYEKQSSNIHNIARSDASLLIIGEPGTMIESIAEDIHSLSNRSGPCVIVDCASIVHSLAQSELFGHVKGAFTNATSDNLGYFEVANNGTLIFLEVDTLPLSMQSMLLRVLQEGQIIRIGENVVRGVNPRIIATCSSNLQGLVKEGVFREDLYNRLSVIPINVPTLRERKKDDIRTFAEQFLTELKNGKNTLGFSTEAMLKLQLHSWPGNLEELRNVVARALILSNDGDYIYPQDIVFDELLTSNS